MEENLDYLTDGIQEQDRGILKNLSQMGEKLKELKLKMLADQAQAEQSKKEYEHYANVIIPKEMYSAGVDSVGLTSGGSLKVKHNFYCQPNKNEADRKKIIDWLRANDGDHIIDHAANVSVNDIDKLKDLDIAFVENLSVNTSKLKSFIKDKLGVTTGVQQITVADIPECVHFQEVTVVELED